MAKIDLDSKERVETWTQGRFIDSYKHRHWTDEMKKEADVIESFIVRPFADGNAICRAVSPDDAKWIAERLNRCAFLEKRIEEIEKVEKDLAAVLDWIKEKR